MLRVAMLALLGALLLSAGPVASSPMKGHYRVAERFDGAKRVRLEPGTPYKFREMYRGNQRACIIVEGDHEPVMDLKIQVADLKGNVIAEDNGPGDVLAVMWYPPRTQEYIVTITGNGTVINLLDVVAK